MARHQNTIEEKLKWDTTALNFALKIEGNSIRSTLPSLYLNIGKCYEDLNDRENATLHYNIARSHFDFLPENGYGNLIKNGVENGIKRVEK